MIDIKKMYEPALLKQLKEPPPYMRIPPRRIPWWERYLLRIGRFIWRCKKAMLIILDREEDRQ